MGYWNGLMYYWADPIGSTHLIGSGICIGLTKINQPTLWHLHFYFYFLKKKIWKLGRAWVKKSYPNLMTRKQLTLTRKTLAPLRHHPVVYASLYIHIYVNSACMRSSAYGGTRPIQRNCMCTKVRFPWKCKICFTSQFGFP
jgi:hypothetical protein